LLLNEHTGRALRKSAFESGVCAALPRAEGLAKAGGASGKLRWSSAMHANEARLAAFVRLKQKRSERVLSAPAGGGRARARRARAAAEGTIRRKLLCGPRRRLLSFQGV
jgi:hypothetical protein